MDDADIVNQHILDEEAKVAASNEKAHLERLPVLVQRKSRLNFLITQAGTYSKWLASRLELRQAELEKKPTESIQTSLGPSDPSSAATAVDSSANGNTKKRTKSSTSQSKKIRVNESKELLDTASSMVVNGTMPSSNSATASTAQKRNHRQPNLVTGCVMREYQLVGMEWLISLWEQGLNGILADEMGLGKTLQTIAFLAHLVEMNVWGPFLIVAPLSTLGNWVSEINRFTPSLKVVLYHGSAPERATIRKSQMSVMNKSFPIVVTSFEMVMNDRRYLQKIKWKYIIVDEGHRLKNMNCRLIRELKTYPSANRLILSGTPLQNNLTELWSLLNFLMPDIFESITDFESWFDFDGLNNENSSNGGTDSFVDKESSVSLVKSLHEILKPFLLRRVKTEVEVDLPKKRELLLFAPLMPKQKELYDACVGGLSQFREYLIDKMDSNTNGVSATPESTGTLTPPSAENGTVEKSNSVVSTRVSEKADDDAKDHLQNQDGDTTKEVNGSEDANSENNSNSKAVRLTRRKSRRLGGQVSYSEGMDDDAYFDMIEGEKALTEAAAAMAKKLSGISEKRSSRELNNATECIDFQLLFAGKIVQNQKLQNLIMQLRKICNHPYLFDVPDDEAEKDFDFHSAIPDQSVNLSQKIPDIVASSGKMLLLERLLPELFKRGHKVLIFSQMTRMLDILADWFEFIKKWKFCRIDGNVTIETRRENIQEFNTNDDVRLFLLSTRSGGLGINLTSADTVIIFDSDWNPQMDLQAQDRVHRIGQTKPVIIYRLVTMGTVEKKILDRAANKRKLEKLVIHKSEFKGNSSYYKEKKVADIEDLVAILEADHAESVSISTTLDTNCAEGDLGILEKVISDEALEAILDRSPEAFLPKGNNAQVGNSQTFQEVAEERDETNDILNNMK
ncbi:hypothetical protein HDU84_006066 [Entophlyctis sp. JEL0112]|nr:hypothetical protein HDU84_006066 [Entophlyctis sp. JEL0112]